MGRTPAHEGNHLQEVDGGHLHNAISNEDIPTFDGDEGHKVYNQWEIIWQDTPTVYGHVSCLGSTILHERGARCAQYSVDYFLEAWHIPELEGIAEKLNVAVLSADEDGCPACRGDATHQEELDWFGENPYD